MITHHLTPAQELQRIEAVAVASTWRCPHCAGEAHIRFNGIVSEYVCPYIVEHAHEPGCPDHDDNFEAVERSSDE